MQASRYRGRFAPSPTGPLHMGSLFAAVVSYLHARSAHGEWYVRIEDLDPPREQADAKSRILNTLIAHGFEWDGPVLYQSSRAEIYEACLLQLKEQGDSYACPCSRKQLLESGGEHSQACQLQQVKHLACAIKFKGQQQTYSWPDLFQGDFTRVMTEDFVLKRKDALYAYQLAVVCDDLQQGMTHIIRGSDLIDSTPMQLALYHALGEAAPAFGHFPVIVAENQQKLSKQNYAPAVKDEHALENLAKIFDYLGLRLSDRPTSAKEALEMATTAWQAQTPAVLDCVTISQ